MTGGGSCENSSCGLRLPAQSLKQLFVNRFQQLRVVIVVVKAGKHLRNQCIMGFRILLPQLFQQAAFLRADALCLEPEADPGPASPGVDDEGISAGEVHTDAGVVAAGGPFIGIGNAGELIPAPVEISVDSILGAAPENQPPVVHGAVQEAVEPMPLGAAAHIGPDLVPQRHGRVEGIPPDPRYPHEIGEAENQCKDQHAARF